MNGSPQLPQYTFDPATQQYRLKTPAEQAQEQQKGKSGLGALYDSGDGGISPSSHSGPGISMMTPGMAEMGVGFQNVGNALSGIPSITTGVIGGLASAAGNAMMGSQVSPVANPSPMTVTPVAPNPAFADPTAGLTAMNAQMAVENEADEAAAAQSAAVGEAASTAAAAAGVGEGPGTGNDAGVNDAPSGDAPSGGDSPSGGGGPSASTSDGPGNEGSGTGNDAGTFREGGIASLAEEVESKGRGNDKMLVHMTPGEVAGLQYLAMQHGGSLTINPDTGLPEAGFLESVLPMIAGAALTATGVGAPLAALMVGGGYGLATGSLEKGLMAGLGAFGGAGLGSALSATGAATTAGQTLTPAAANAAAVTPQAAAAAPSYALSSGASPAAGMGLGGGLTIPQVTTLTPTAAAPGLTLSGSAAAPVTQVAGAVTPAAAPVTFSNMGAGIKALGTEAGRSAFMTAAGGPMGLATKVGGPLVSGMFSAEEPDEGGKKPQEYVRPYSFDFKPSAETDPNFKFRTGERGESTAEQRYFAPTFTPMGVFKGGTEPGGSFYGTPTEDLYKLYSEPKQLAAGGIAGLKKGRFLDDKTDSTGNSDGMSDSLPAVINGEQPARLTDGEFVVPADVVSHLGNGSSKAGAKRLHNMMDRIRAARTGTKKQAPAVKAERFMPA